MNANSTNALYLIDDSDVMKRKLLIISVHFIAWFIFLSIPGFFRPSGPGEHGNGIIDDIFVPHRTLNALYLLAIFYCNYYIAIPRFYLKGKQLSLFLYISGTVAGLIFINYSIIHYGIARRPPESLFVYLGPSHNLLMFLIVSVFSFALSLYNQWRKAREEKLNAEISFLKAQINPHFLFNTLNSIYSLALTKSDKAPEAVVKLSSMMRYAISEAEHNFVALEKEVEYISNFIALQKLRLTDTIVVNYHVSGNAIGKQVAPFLLIPFIENAFKYGVNSEENSQIYIDISINDSYLQLTVINNKVYVQKDKDSGLGLGIKNTQQRLNMIYPGKHNFVVKNHDDQFEVLLKIFW